MKFCPQHLDKLRLRVIGRGLGVYLAKNDAELAQRMRAALHGTSWSRANFEPSLLAQSLILNNALESVGATRMSVLEAGDPESVCPLCCMASEFDNFDEDDWYTHAVADTADVARSAGLLTLQ